MDYNVSEQMKNFGGGLASSDDKDSDEFSELSGMKLLKDGSIASSSLAGLKRPLTFRDDDSNSDGTASDVSGLKYLRNQTGDFSS